MLRPSAPVVRLKGGNMPAQGNALGNDHHLYPSP
jgi:hypothetical protein